MATIIQLKRQPSSGNCTIGTLTINGLTLRTLEDVERPVKVYGETAIPKGRYKVINTMSNRFKRMMPLLVNVPGYEGVRIHAGNTSKDTEGCILLGMGVSGNSITESRKAIDLFTQEFEKALKLGDVFIEIS